MSSIRQHAHRVMRFGEGQPLAQGPVDDPAIARSWRRCLEQHRLDPARPDAPCVIEHPRLAERREPLHNVIAIARWQMNSLHQQLGGNGRAVLLTDTEGVVIDSLCHPAEHDEFQRAGLWLGAVWSEAVEGTNGVGTCLVERQPLTIRRDEHFRGRHTGLSCSAIPLFDPQGALQAVLNVSSIREELSGQSQFHAMALTTLSAKLIESCSFLQQCEDRYLLRFHAQPEFIGLLSEGLLAFDGSGRVDAVNEAALALLGQPREALVGLSVESLFDVRLDDLLARARPQPDACWPLHVHDGRLLHARLRGARLRTLAEPVRRPAVPDPGLCLGDPALRTDFARALKVLERDVPVLLHGETGTGKEAFASALHRASSRAGKPFVALNCAAIPENLIESELFGYRGGSFTGARKEGMEGKLQQADGGILFLDEIGDMPLALQTRLLRVLEERQVVPLGGAVPQPVDIRLLSASHRDLQALVAEGRFREDLTPRLTGGARPLPPRRAPRDREALLDHLLRQEARGEPVTLEPAARSALLAYAWPGNVRQLRNVLRTLVALCEDGRVPLAEVERVLPAAVAPVAVAPVDPLAAAERDTLLAAVQARHWHLSRVADELGISRNTLYRKLRKYGIARQPG